MPRYRYTFISHAHVDNALCDPFAEELVRLGVDHYYDREKPDHGDSLSLALQREIERAGVLIVMCSPEAIESFWVNEEIDMFMSLMADDRTRKIVPVIIERCELPPRLKARWSVNAVGRPPRDVVAALAHALRADRPSAASPDEYTSIVDRRRGKGDYATIAAAIIAAQPGDRILIRKGVYEGGAVIDKPLTLVGDGQPGDVEMRASGISVIRFKADHGRLANLTLRQVGGHGYGVDIAAGNLEMENCDVSSQGSACISIHGDANPHILHCSVHGGERNGIFVHDQGQGVIEDCDIIANAFAGVEVKTGGTPTVRKCRINQNASEGIYVHNQGGGVFVENDLSDNNGGLWDISEDCLSLVTLRDNTE